MKFLGIILLLMISSCLVSGFKDISVKSYQTERTCLYNEICKEEFTKIFRCRCPSLLNCRSQGKYYNAFCTITESGYIWHQAPFELSRNR